LEKGGYVPWASRFMRFLDNKQEEGERIRHSIKVGSYKQKMIQNPDKLDYPTTTIIEPPRKMTESSKKQYFSDIKVMEFLLQGIPNDIYNFVDACKTTKQMWEWIRRLMHVSGKTEQQRHSRLVNEFDKFVAVEGDLYLLCMKGLQHLMVVKEIEDGLLEEIEVSHFRKEVMILEWMSCLGLMRFDWWMEFLMVHLEELEMNKLLLEKV
ncbi:hypothetical protein Tco_1291784, partial [Tanacetum coccineum]